MDLGKIGFGTYTLTDINAAELAINTALLNGYKLIDTASYYNNEDIIGKITKNINKENFLITTKIWPSDLAYDDALRSFENSYKKLNEKIDILLIHWPHPEKFLEGYKALERIKEQGLVKEIGVANFEIRHLEKIKNKCNIKPFLNQIEAHPKFAQNELNNYLKKEEILFQSWSPIARNIYSDNKIISDIAKSHNVSSSQIILAWHIARGYHPIPKSATPKHIIENIMSEKIILSSEELLRLNSLDNGDRTGMHPELFPYDKF